MNKITKIGNFAFTNLIMLAPMDGVTDHPFRMVCKNLGADIVFSEFIQAEGFINDYFKIEKRANFKTEERPFAIQLYSGDFDIMKQAVLKAINYKPDIIDLNFGCWKPDIVKRGAGAGILRTPEKMIEMTSICAEICDSKNIPLTVKTRLGWDKESIIIVELAPELEKAGAKALSLHCRTREQAMGGDADWSFISKTKANINIPLILNGDIFNYNSAYNAMKTEGADGIMIGRGAIGNPFIFKQSKEIIENEKPPKLIGIEERFNTCKAHLNYAFEEKREIGITMFRKHYSGYLKDLPFAEEYRKKLVLLNSIKEIYNLLDEYYEFLKINNLTSPIEMSVGKTPVWRMHHKHNKNL